MTVVFLKFFFKPLKQSKRIGGRTGETGQNLTVVQFTHFTRSAFNNRVAECDLTVAANGDEVAATNRYDGGAVILFQFILQ